MRVIWGLLTLLGALQTVLLLMGVGIGFLLHWIIPGLDIGTAVLVGAMCAISSGLFLVLFVQIAPVIRLRAEQFGYGGRTEEVEDDEDDEDGDLDEYAEMEIRDLRPRSRSRARRQRGKRR